MGADNATKPILKDPVCGMTVTDQSPHLFNYKGSPVYFCSARCKTKFSAHPEKYFATDHGSEVLKTKPVSSDDAPTRTVYTCPMHPEIRQYHAGACPRCGMALEPEMPSLEDSDRPELADFKGESHEH